MTSMQTQRGCIVGLWATQICFVFNFSENRGYSGARDVVLTNKFRGDHINAVWVNAFFHNPLQGGFFRVNFAKTPRQI